MRGRPRKFLVLGSSHGAWTVVRTARPDGQGKSRWLCRASCCGREQILYRVSVLAAPEACRCCRGTAVVRSEPAIGETYGCWTIVAERERKWNQRRFLCRASCCGVQAVKQHSDIRRAAKTCLRCKSNGRGAPSLRFAVEA